MGKLSLLFEEGGMYTSVQDDGRMGSQDIGLPFGGAMDRESMQIANALVGNQLNNPVLELTLTGPTIKFEGSGHISVTGADMTPALNGESMAMYETVTVENGDMLTFGPSTAGCRSYLAIAGEWDAPRWQGSYSSFANTSNQDGSNGHFLKGDQLHINTLEEVEHKVYPKERRPIYSSCYILRVVSGPDFEQFGIESIEHFFNNIFSIDAQSNRMGYRLNGTLKNYVTEKEEISSGIIPGTVQITKSGQPIIMTADAQTTGGYPRIVNVISEDLDILGQMKPGDELKFMLVSLEDA